jgi:cytochrome c biogenesis protein CcmG, thiol:disulfide interchange protein DsbE
VRVANGGFHRAGDELSSGAMSANRGSFRTWRGLSPLILVASLIVFSCGGGASDSGGGRAEQPTTDFRLATLEGGRQLGPRDFGDHVVLVDFWATWCVPCHAQARILKSVFEGLDGNKAVQFLAVDVGEDAETVRRFVADNPFPYPVLIDPQDTLSYELGIVGLPTLMVVDRKGKVVYFEPGVIDGDSLRRILADAGEA